MVRPCVFVKVFLASFSWAVAWYLGRGALFRSAKYCLGYGCWMHIRRKPENEGRAGELGEERSHLNMNDISKGNMTSECIVAPETLMVLFP